ncbi:YdcF family protein [Cyanobacteria bacterium FACHB-63]|nr:YdcF family protein [Cyanobacteria bacterium FACHB-63]
MILLVTDVFVLLTQVLLWVVVGLFAWYVLLRVLPRPFLGGLVLLLLVGVAAFTFYRGSPQEGLVGDIFRIIAIPFSPLGIILILLLVAFSELLRGGKLSRTGLVLLRIAIPALLILSIPAVSYFLAQRAEAEAIDIARPAATAALPPGARRVIVALAQDTTRLQVRPRSQPVPAAPAPPAPGLFPPPAQIPAGAFPVLADQPVQLTERGDILTYTNQVYREERGRGTDPLVIVSAGNRPERVRKTGETNNDVSEAADARRFLQGLGIPAEDIIADPNSPTVQSSAVNVRQELRRRGTNFGNQLVLISSAIEMNRAALTFNREFNSNNVPLTVIPRPTNFLTLPPREAFRGRAQGRDVVERNLQIADLLPSIDALSLSSRVINEYLTSIYYFLRGWIRPVRTTL